MEDRSRRIDADLEQALDALGGRRRRTPDQVRAWGQEVGVDDWLDRSLGWLAGQLGRSAWSPWPLAEDLAVGNQQAEELLAAALRTRLEQRAVLEELQPIWSAAAVAPPLAPLHQALLEALDPVHPPIRRDARVEVVGDPPGLSLDEGREVATAQPVDLSEASQALVWAALDLLCDLHAPEAVAARSTLVGALARTPAERDLDALVQALTLPPAPIDGPRSAWLLSARQGRWTLVAALATPRRSAGWQVKRFDRSKHPEPAWLPADLRARDRHDLLGQLAELREHPRVFVRHDGRCDGQPRQVRWGTLGLSLAHGPGDTARIGLQLDGRLLPPDALRTRVDAGPAWLVDVTDEAIEVAHMGPAVHAVAALLAVRGGLEVPAGPALLQRLPALADQLPIRAEEGVLGEPVAGEMRPLVRFTWLRPDGSPDQDEPALEVEARVQPLAEAPSQPVGAGPELLVARRGGRVVHVHRHLAQERASVAERLAPLELPASALVGAHGFRWRIDDVQAALDVVARARTAALDPRWGGDRPGLVDEPLLAGNLSLRVRDRGSGGNDWFGLQGLARLGSREVPLAALLHAALEGHRWVPLSDGQWVRLQADLRAQLVAVAGATHDPEATELRPVHAALLAPLEDAGAQIDAPATWADRADRCRQAQHRAFPPPAGLQATLRPYQREGVAWLQRLASWSPGAVLADDMGLGKTLQTLALLLAHSDRPSLVVAPTSLVHNWAREAERFTPAVQPAIYHGPDRVLSARPGQLTITTYGVLVNDLEALQGVAWGTVVYDEAHALKNPTAQRTRAAAALEATFALALTGTPVENRTEELWSLFRVVVPGLLGASRAFQQHFVGPITAGDTDRRDALARRIAPFVLRRTKRQVARDLPERTELVRRVLLSSAERTLYDRARLSAVARLRAEAGARTQVFRELLRLRQLACHPRLADAHSEVPSSKLVALRRLVADARRAGERVLVFSTFTRHLALMRPALTADGHQVLQLDGSMSPAQRAAEVDAFQAGHGDVFLISTKAGGVGLNLTAASTVIHADPWWNPASEDQATDRAHRIGQDRPVTVVRLVAADTIEEQIVALHATKRGLADALLAHSGDSRSVSMDELLDLLGATGTA